MSLGWNVSKEDFWPENNVLTNFKIRGSYGITGNDRIADFAYASLVQGGFTYTFGSPGLVNGQVLTPGSTIVRPANPDLKWEETTAQNIALDFTFFGDLSLSLDLWKKETKDILDYLRIPSYAGLDSPVYNIGDVQNTGFDIELGYNKSFGDWKVGLNGNISYFKNKVNRITEGLEVYGLSGIQSMNGFLNNNVSYVRVGDAMGTFYGLKTNGIFQNQAEIDAYVGSDGTPIQPDARPGDFRWSDVNGDGAINADDNTKIGQALPDFTYGFTINLAYKNFDFNMMAQGVSGNQIFNGLRRLELQDANWQGNALQRWTGEGTSNSFPRMTASDPNGNYSKVSDFYLEDGDYLRIKTVQLGYSLPNDVIGKAGMSRARIYLMAENLLTFTKYTGYDPEIGGGNVTGIDRGFYPQARSYMVGVNLQF